MDITLSKTALVTGAGGRLGQAMAVALGKDGYAVAVHYNHSSDGADETCAAINSAGGKAFTIQADLSDEEAVSGLVGKSAEALGQHIAVLINNASVFEEDDALSHSRESWDLHMNVNLRAPVRLSQSFAKALPEEARGLVINMIDQRVWKLNPNFFTYTLSKSALWTVTRTLAQGLAPRIRVNGIGPGPTMQNARQQSEDFKKQVDATLTGRGASPDDIVRAMKFLIEADAVTGQMIAVDGGQHLIWQTPDVVDVIE